MIKIADNFGYQGPKPNFERDYYKTTSLLKAVSDDVIDDGHLGYCEETKTHYIYNYSNTIDDALGKWREWKPIDTELKEGSGNAVSSSVVFSEIKKIKDTFDALKKDVDDIVIDTELKENSTNAVQNKVITAELNALGAKITEAVNSLTNYVLKEEVESELLPDSTLPVQNKVINKSISDIKATLDELKKRVDKVEPVDTALSSESTKPVQNKAIALAFEEVDKTISEIKETMEGIEYYSNYSYCVSDWLKDDPTLSPKAQDQYGDPEILSDWQFYFIDHSAITEDGERVKPICKLKKNNILRDENGNFVRTVYTNILGRFLYTKDDGQTYSFFDFDSWEVDPDSEGRIKWGKLWLDPACPENIINPSWTGEDNPAIPQYLPGWNWRFELNLDESIDIFLQKLYDFTEELYKTYGKDVKVYWKNEDFEIYELKNSPKPWEEFQITHVTGISGVNNRGGWGENNPAKSVVLGYPKKCYLVDQVEGKSGRVWKGLFIEPSYWDGIDVTQYPLDTTGIFPSPATAYIHIKDSEISNRSLTTVRNTKNYDRMFCRYIDYYYENPVGSVMTNNSLNLALNCQGHLGEANLTGCFMSQEVPVSGISLKRFAYGRSMDVSQLTNCTWMRRNNLDPQSPVPFAEGGYHSRNTFVSAMESLYKTKYLNETSFFASGISANDAVTNETQWRAYGGIRWRLKDSGNSWSYGTWNTSPNAATSKNNGGAENNAIFTNVNGTSTTHFNALLAYWFPKEQVLESQTAASIAVEYGVEPGETFEFGNGEWWYSDIPGTKTLKEGDMNCIIYKKIPVEMQGYNAQGNKVPFELEIILRMSLMNGYNHSGDYWIYYGGGYEQVGTVTNVNNGTAGNPVVIWTCFDQREWDTQANLQVVTKDNLGTFSFEDNPNYWKAWEGTNLGDSYTAVRPSYTAYKSKAGGSLSTGECFWSYTSKHWSSTLNQRVRVGNRFRITNYNLSDIIGYRVISTVHAHGETGARDMGGSGQVLLKLD